MAEPAEITLETPIEQRRGMALDVNREAVRVLAQAIGVRAAAREMGLKEDTVAAWSVREKWGIKELQEKTPALRPSRAISGVQANIPTAAEALASHMEKLAENTRLGFAKASAKVAEKFGESSAEEIMDIKSAAAAKSWAQTAAIAHGWSNGNGSTVNVAVALRLDMDE